MLKTVLGTLGLCNSEEAGGDFWKDYSDPLDMELKPMEIRGVTLFTFLELSVIKLQ